MITMIEEQEQIKRKMVTCPRCECVFGFEVNEMLRTSGYVHINDLWELWDQIRGAMVDQNIDHERYNSIIRRLNKLMNISQKPIPAE
jgi:hypothetical protein